MNAIFHLGLAQTSVDAICFANTIIFASAHGTSEELAECSQLIWQGRILFICDNFLIPVCRRIFLTINDQLANGTNATCCQSLTTGVEVWIAIPEAS